MDPKAKLPHRTNDYLRFIEQPDVAVSFLMQLIQIALSRRMTISDSCLLVADRLSTQPAR